MAVDAVHPDYAEQSPEWDQQRDCLRGERRVKARGVAYLPKSSGQALAEKKLAALGLPASVGPYEASKAMARFPELLETAVTGFTGLATRIPWSIEGLPGAMEYLLRNAGAGIPLEGWQPKLIAEGLAIGRYALFPDAPADGGDARIQWYPAESLINWQVDDEKNLTLAVLREKARTAKDEFSHDMEDRYRVIRMDGARATVDLYAGTGAKMAVQRSFTLGEGFPLIIGGVRENGPVVERPPLAGLAEALLSYYRLSASHRWAIRQTCDPTMLALGFKPDEIQAVGAGMIITKDCAPSEASIQYIEIQGNGLTHVHDEMDREIERAISQTHRLAEKSDAEASSAIRQRSQSKTAVLNSVDKCAARALEDALNHIARMNRLPAEITVTTALDYTEDDIDAQVLRSLVEAVGLGQLPGRVVRDYVKKRGLIDDVPDEEITALMAEEQERREAEAVGFEPDQTIVAA